MASGPFCESEVPDAGHRVLCGVQRLVFGTKCLVLLRSHQSADLIPDLIRRCVQVLLDLNLHSFPDALRDCLFVWTPGVHINAHRAEELVKPPFGVLGQVEVPPESPLGDIDMLFLQVLQGRRGAFTSENDMKPDVRGFVLVRVTDLPSRAEKSTMISFL